MENFSDYSTIQAGILTGLHRDHARYLFVRFKGGGNDRELIKKRRQWVARFSATLTSQKRWRNGKSSKAGRHEVIRTLSLGHSAYLRLGCAPEEIPDDGLFRGRSLATRDDLKQLLGVYNKSSIHGTFRRPPPFDFLISLAHDDAPILDREVTRLKKALKDDQLCAGKASFWLESGKVKYADFSDMGKPVRRKVEAFGFADNVTKVPKSDRHKIGLVREGKTNGWGSYLAYLKLEQDVEKFNQIAIEMAEALGSKDPEYAKSMLVGRFKDGTPLTFYDRPADPSQWEDRGLDFTDDSEGNRCPFHAHLRIVREAGHGKGGSMASILRRGIPYREKSKFSVDRRYVEGLQFFCYQRSLTKQFLPLFRAIVEKRDPLVYNLRNDGAVPEAQKWPQSYNSPKRVEFESSIHKLVTLRAGGFYFTPSLLFLKRLDKT